MLVAASKQFSHLEEHARFLDRWEHDMCLPQSSAAFVLFFIHRVGDIVTTFAVSPTCPLVHPKTALHPFST